MEEERRLWKKFETDSIWRESGEQRRSAGSG